MHPIARTDYDFSTLLKFRHDPSTTWHVILAVSLQQCMPFILVDLIIEIDAVALL